MVLPGKFFTVLAEGFGLETQLSAENLWDICLLAHFQLFYFSETTGFGML